jgi:uncharacterized protein (DUF2147 family)
MMQRPRSATRTLASCGFLLTIASGPAFAGDPTGDWKVADGVAHIRVAECQGSMWGAVAWEKIPGGRDRNNPDASKRSRPTLGMAILHNMKKKPGVDQWEGEVYNAKDGKRYESTITLKSPNQLEIEGCVLGFLCGGETWTRVSGPIPSSPSNAVAEAPRGAAAKSSKHNTAPAPKSATGQKTGSPKTVGQKAGAHAGTQDTADIGDICLLPEIARATH